MKAAFRIFCLTLVLVAALYSPASAYWGTCFYSCPEGAFTATSTYAQCCLGGSTFLCPSGEPGVAYGYAEEGGGGNFC